MSNAATGQPSPRSIYSSAGRLDDHGHQRFRLPAQHYYLTNRAIDNRACHYNFLAAPLAFVTGRAPVQRTISPFLDARVLRQNNGHRVPG